MGNRQGVGRAREVECRMRKKIRGASGWVLEGRVGTTDRSRWSWSRFLLARPFPFSYLWTLLVVMFLSKEVSIIYNHALSKLHVIRRCLIFYVAPMHITHKYKNPEPWFSFGVNLVLNFWCIRNGVDDQIWQVWENRTARFGISKTPVLTVPELHQGRKQHKEIWRFKCVWSMEKGIGAKTEEIGAKRWSRENQTIRFWISDYPIFLKQIELE
jgi:hypothetical protein